MATLPLPPVLLAEDDPNDLFLVRRHLARAGIKNPIVSFTAGDELIGFLRASCVEGTKERGLRPCVVLVDIKMPRCDGFEVLRWIRNQAALSDLKVVLLTGSDEPRDIARAKELGADRFLTKFPPPSVFAEIIGTPA